MALNLNWIARLGQNPQFVAAFAHASVFVPVLVLSHFVGGRPLWYALAIVVYAAWKEFLFDIKEEHNPPQTYLDGLQDFLGYQVGAWGAVLVLHYW